MFQEQLCIVGLTIICLYFISFAVDLKIDRQIKTSGTGTSLQRAQQDAADKAITQISKEISRCYPKVVKQSEILLKVGGCLLILFVVKYPMKYGTFLTI